MRKNIFSGAAVAAALMALVGCGFMGASVSKLAFPSLGRYVCALLGGAVVGLLRAIPYLGTLVALVAYVYLLGYVLQTIYLGLHKEGPATGAPKDPTADDFVTQS
jgi:hypothetical protein